MPHLEKRRNLWYAVLTIPEDVRPTLGQLRFRKSTGESDPRKAQIIANQYVAGWKVRIEQARGASPQRLSEALEWREQIEGAANREVLQDLLLDKAETLERTKGFAYAKNFYDVAAGVKTPSNIAFNEWKAQLHLAPKTVERMTKDVEMLIHKFECLEDIQKRSVKQWVDELASQGSTLSSNRRVLGSCKSYWKYLQSKDHVEAELQPFQGVLAISKTLKTSKASWVPFTALEVVALWKEAMAKGDQQLADLIYIAAYTGARIEELCSLKISDVTEGALRITESKTEAGKREVPIHSALEGAIARLKEGSSDGYLISGLSINKYGDRSNAIGKRFGRIKKSLGYSELHVFHSIRKTLVTLLENARVGEGVAADIVGHEKQTITFGLYSGGNSLAVKKEAIERVSYPF